MNKKRIKHECTKCGRINIANEGTRGAEKAFDIAEAMYEEYRKRYK